MPGTSRAATLVAVYRALMREARTLSRENATLPCRRPVSREEWGKGHFESSTAGGYHREVLSAILPGVTTAPEDGIFTGKTLAESISYHFRHGMKGEGEEDGPDTAVDHALNALKVLGDQIHLNRCSSVAETEGVRVEATSSYLPSESSPDSGRYTFAYRLRIENVSHGGPVKLLGRHWLIEDAQGGVVELPKGSPGVVGYYPELAEGACFQYTSGTDLETATGAMTGSFQMKYGGGEEGVEGGSGGGKPVGRGRRGSSPPQQELPYDFDCAVAPFRLVGPTRRK